MVIIIVKIIIKCSIYVLDNYCQSAMFKKFYQYILRKKNNNILYLLKHIVNN